MYVVNVFNIVTEGKGGKQTFLQNRSLFKIFCPRLSEKNGIEFPCVQTFLCVELYFAKTTT